MAQRAAQLEREALSSEYAQDDAGSAPAALGDGRRAAGNSLSADQVLDKITERITGRLREEIRQEVVREEQELAKQRDQDEREQMGKLEGFLAGSDNVTARKRSHSPIPAHSLAGNRNGANVICSRLLSRIRPCLCYFGADSR
jgi:hypothetical protein